MFFAFFSFFSHNLHIFINIKLDDNIIHTLVCYRAYVTCLVTVDKYRGRCYKLADIVEFCIVGLTAFEKVDTFEKVDDKSGDFVLQVVKYYTLPDGQEAVKVMRIK